MLYKPKEWQYSLIIFLIFALLLGCSRWSIVQKPEKTYLMENRPLEVEVELRTGEKLILYLPFVKGDSLYGGKSINYYSQGMIPDDTVAVSFLDISEIKEKQSHPAGKKIALWMTAFLLITGLLVLLYFYARGSAYPEGGIG